MISAASREWPTFEDGYNDESPSWIAPHAFVGAADDGARCGVEVGRLGRLVVRCLERPDHAIHACRVRTGAAVGAALDSATRGPDAASAGKVVG